MKIRMAVFALVAFVAVPMFAQQQPNFPPDQLDELVARVALYPDPLLTQILAAATYPDQISDAANWADQHHYLRGQELADAIQNDQLPWDPSVQALLPFPDVLGRMASDMNWTTDLGNAFLAQQQDVMDAIQRQRQRAQRYGYLRSNGQIIVEGGPYITIMPANPAYVPVPYYDPRVVYYAPRPGFFVGGAIRLGYGVTIGGFFRPWGWGGDRFEWRERRVIVNNTPWRRDWGNRARYVHPYAEVRRYQRTERPAERHQEFRRSEPERREAREGRPIREEHRVNQDRRGNRDQRQERKNDRRDKKDERRGDRQRN